AHLLLPPQLPCWEQNAGPVLQKRGSVVVPSPSAVQLRLLGSVEAIAGGDRLELGGPVPRAIVAVLALSANHVVPSDRLADAIWNGEPPATWTRTLQSYVARLRGVLATSGATIETRKPGFVLTIDAGDIDLTQFAELSARASGALDRHD